MKLVLLLPLWALTAQAQLAVTVAPPKITGRKAVVTLEMKNRLAGKIESARAVCFLADEQGKVIGQSTQWVIGGTKDRLPLAARATNRFHFVLTSPRPFPTTNPTAQVQFSRVILESGPVADVNGSVRIEHAENPDSVPHKRRTGYLVTLRASVKARSRRLRRVWASAAEFGASQNSPGSV